MSKLNKTQTNQLVATTIANTINAHSNLFKKDKSDEMIDILTKALAQILAPQVGGGTSNKIDSEGNVYCNYFKVYMPADQFNTKLTKANKTTGARHEAPKANCILAEQILRKIKTLKRNVEIQATENMRNKTISLEEFDTILSNLDSAVAAHYDTVEAVPTVADVVGLTATLAK